MYGRLFRLRDSFTTETGSSLKFVKAKAFLRYHYRLPLSSRFTKCFLRDNLLIKKNVCLNLKANNADTRRVSLTRYYKLGQRCVRSVKRVGEGVGKTEF